MVATIMRAAGQSGCGYSDGTHPTRETRTAWTQVSCLKSLGSLLQHLGDTTLGPNIRFPVAVRGQILHSEPGCNLFCSLVGRLVIRNSNVRWDFLDVPASFAETAECFQWLQTGCILSRALGIRHRLDGDLIVNQVRSKLLQSTTSIASHSIEQSPHA